MKARGQPPTLLKTGETGSRTSLKLAVRHGRAWTFGIAALLVALDQLLKAIVTTLLPAGGADVGPLFHFRHVVNAGVNFGLLADYPEAVLIVTLLVALAFVTYVIARPPHSLGSMAGLALILGGGLGNVVDRLRLGAVIDYLNITPFVGYLNFADLAIGSGALLLILETVWLGQRGHRL